MKSDKKAAPTLAELADQILDSYSRGVSTALKFGEVSIALKDEQELVELAEMARKNGALILYSRQLSGDRVLWKNMLLDGDPRAVAWFIRELNGDRNSTQIQAD